MHDPRTAALVRTWLAEAETIKPSTAATLLAGVLSEEGGLEFTVGFVDGVIRPEDPKIAAENFRALAATTPAFLPWQLRAAVRLGAAISHLAPRMVATTARRVLRKLVGHLIIDSTDAHLGAAIARIKATGRTLNVNPLGEAVLGPREAAKRLEVTRRLLERDDVDYVSIKVSSTVAPHSPWAYPEAVAHISSQLLPLYRYAAAQPARKFINLDMEEYRDLDLTMDVFMGLLDRPELLGLEAGIVLQAYLPDAMAAMMRLQQWAAARRARGGAPIKVRLVKGANLPMERVEAALHGWPLAVVTSKQEADTNYKRILNWAMTSERVKNVHLGIAGHNLFDVAHAWLLANDRGLVPDPSPSDGPSTGQNSSANSNPNPGVDQSHPTTPVIEFEMLLGMAEAQAEAVSRTVGSLLLYTPVVHPSEFDVAISYLVRRLEEGAAQDNFMSAVFQLAHSEQLFNREQARFEASLDHLETAEETTPDNPHVPQPRRTQNRLTDIPTPQFTFANTPDTDPALPANRAWARAILAAIPSSTLGADIVRAHTITDAHTLVGTFATAQAAAPAWAALGGAGRAHVLRAIAVELEKQRAALIEVAAAECGKTIEQSDPEVSEAIDFANYYAELAEQLDHVDGAQARPVQLTVVTPPWNFPVAIPAGSTLAALAAGSAVVIKPATQARRCGSVMVEALWAGLDACGVSRDVLQLVHVDEGELGRLLVSDPRVDRLILTGAFETAQLFRSWRPGLQLLAETSGKNAIVVTEHADLDLAVKDIVNSAFGHAGQKCSAASLAILVGSVGRSRRFRTQLLDAVSGLKVAFPSDPSAQMGPLIEPPSGKLLRALTHQDSKGGETLGEGDEREAESERWALTPRQLSADGRLWSPGVKSGVQPGSEFHLTEYFGPILGIMTVSTLADAISAQNATAYGLTAGLHSLDSGEIDRWMQGVQAGNLYVNRGITGAIVRRQPFGGWKRSAVGAGAKAGGPNYLFALSDWVREPSRANARGAFLAGGVPALISDDTAAFLRAVRKHLAGLGLGRADVEFIERSAASDAQAWDSEFGVVRDVSGLVVERNELRYLPTLTPVVVRAEEDAQVADVLRVVAAGLAARGKFEVSLARPNAELERLLVQCDVSVAVDSSTLQLGSPQPSSAQPCPAQPGWLVRMGDGRARIVGNQAEEVAAQAVQLGTNVAFYTQPVTEAGRLEMLPFLLEQAVSQTAHRFGTVRDGANEPG